MNSNTLLVEGYISSYYEVARLHQRWMERSTVQVRVPYVDGAYQVMEAQQCQFKSRCCIVIVVNQQQ